MYIYKVNILLFDSNYNPELENKINDKIDELLIKNSGECVSEEVVDIYETNLGICTECGSWCSNPSEENYINEVSPGCVINGKWYCDICLPSNHPLAF